MKKIYSRKVFKTLCEKTHDVRELSCHNWKSFENYEERLKSWLFYSYSFEQMKSDIDFLKNAMIYKYRIQARLSENLQDTFLKNEFKPVLYSYGAYPLFYINSDSSVICPNCFKEEIKSHCGDYNGLHKAIDLCPNYENTSLYCDFCSERIESAYCEDEAKKEGVDNE